MSSNPHGANPHGPTLQGIDVAYPQGHRFDWSLVAADGIRFAWVKATQGAERQNIDPTFVRNWVEAKRNGVLRGAYHFLSPNSDPLLQAEHYLRTVGSLDSADLHPMLDVEVDHAKPASLILGHALRWTERVEAETGRPVVVYTYPSFWTGNLGAPVGHPLGTRPLWLAHYVVDPVTGKVFNLRAPATPRTWESWRLWQTSGNRGPRIPGIPVDVDRDVFWGDEVAFRDAFSLVHAAKTDPAPPGSDPPDTIPQTPTSRSSQRLKAVREPQPIYEGSPGIVVPEGEHTIDLDDPEPAA